MQRNNKPTISHFVMMGDSLSDRGTMDRRKLFGVIPMSWLSGLAGRSPRGRFTNGFAWSDYISAMLADEFIIQHAERKGHLGGHRKHHLDAADVADDILTGRKLNANRKFSHEDSLDAMDVADEVITDSRFKKRIQNSYTLDNDLHVQYQGRDFVRSYDEGGLTSHDYSWAPSTSVSRFFSRLILSTLSEKRQKLMEDDHRHAVTKKQKSETLVVEWSGANDLITVNREPSRAEADRAIRDRIRNAEKLIASGYRNFVLFNLPDLSLTPRYQNKTGPDGENERKNAHEVSLYFNDKLKRACKKLRRKYPQCKINVFDVCSTFTDIYNDTKNQTHKYPGQFEKDKLTTPFTSEKPEIRNNLSPATGYMFWDDVHPTADMHALLGNEFYKKYRNKFHFTQPVVDAKSLCEAFKKKYNEKLGDDLFGFFGLFRNANPPRLDPENPSRSITIILRHALYEGGGRTKKVIMELGWIDDKGKINVQIPALKIAKSALDSEIFASNRKSPHRRS